jgi:uroporphyrinogen decarboxylase
MTTHRERIQACIQNERTDRTPVALWRHFPNEDQNAETLAKATFDFQNTYDFDIVKVTPASSFMVKDWGVQDEWQNNPEGSRAYTKHVIKTPQDWESLKALDPLTAPHLSGQLACLRSIKHNLDSETPLIQTVFNPLSQAKNLAGNDLLLEHIRKYPEAVIKGLETITKTTIKFIEAINDIGVDGIFYAMQHAQGNQISLDDYKSIALPFDQEVLKPADSFWCNMLHLLRLLHFQIVNWHDRESYPSLIEAQSLFRGVVCGGIRQDTLQFGNQDEVIKEAEDAIIQTGDKKFILSTGCVVPYVTSHENIMAARKSVE